MRGEGGSELRYFILVLFPLVASESCNPLPIDIDVSDLQVRIC